jgi:flagellar protein FliJ
MKRFTFKLENVLHYRVTLENLAKSAYQEALRLLNMEKERLLTLEHIKTDLMQGYNIKPGTVVHPETLSFIARYTSQLLYLIERQKHLIQEKESLARDSFETWNQKRKDVKVIERLKEKKWKEYLRESEKEDQKFQDEIFIAKTIRQREAER